MTLKRPLPANYRSDDADLFAAHRHYALPETGPVTFRNTLANGMGYLFQGPRLLPESFPDTLESKAWKWEWNGHARPLKRIKTLAMAWRNVRGGKIREPSLWFTDTWSLSYYFWFVETLPRLCSVENLWREGMPVYVPEHYYRVGFVKHSLACFDIPDLRTVPSKRSYRFRELVVPRRTAGIHHAHPQYLQRASEILRTGGPAEPWRKVQISRAKARIRRFVNQDEVDALFQKHGFETVCMEDLDWPEQAQLMRECCALASIHGAGLANMVMMAPGSRILEMRMRGPFNSSYYNMAHACGHRYYYMSCEPEKEGVHEQKNNFWADLELLEKTLQGMDH